MTWTCPECGGSAPVLATDSRDEVFLCPWCKHELAVYPQDLDQYSNMIPPVTTRVKTDDSEPQGLLKRLFT